MNNIIKILFGISSVLLLLAITYFLKRISFWSDRDIWAGYWGSRMEIEFKDNSNHRELVEKNLLDENKKFYTELLRRKLIKTVHCNFTNENEMEQFAKFIGENAIITYRSGESLIGGQNGVGHADVSAIDYEFFPRKYK